MFKPIVKDILELMHLEVDRELSEWEPQTPSYKIPATQTAALAHMIQINGTMMLQLSRSLAKGNIKGARVKLRSLFRRLDAALAQLDTLEKRARRQRR
jgi:hypothetical protein